MELRTKKQKLYFAEVIRLHRQYGYGEDRISRILPIGHTTVSRWIGTFARENKSQLVVKPRSKSKKASPEVSESPSVTELKALETEVVRLKAQLAYAEFRADAYDEMINVAESKFNISIRKKVGVKR